MAQRLFIAVELPASARPIVEGVAKRLSALGARVPSAANIHITLLFLGMVPESKIPGIKSAMESLGERRFACAIKGLGYLPKGRPNVIYANIVKGASELSSMNAELKERMGALGIATERRGYTPHLTLSRFKPTSDIEGIRKLVMESEEPAIEFVCDEIRLKSSVLTSGGPIHTDLYVKSLGP